jgi:thiosulfate reductase cytochrome b subunit
MLIATGLFMLFSERAPERLLGIDGLAMIGIAHYVLACSVILFAFSHLYLTTTGRKITSHLKAMVTGWHEE